MRQTMNEETAWITVSPEEQDWTNIASTLDWAKTVARAVYFDTPGVSNVERYNTTFRQTDITVFLCDRSKVMTVMVNKDGEYRHTARGEKKETVGDSLGRALYMACRVIDDHEAVADAPAEARTRKLDEELACVWAQMVQKNIDQARYAQDEPEIDDEQIARLECYINGANEAIRLFRELIQGQHEEAYREILATRDKEY